MTQQAKQRHPYVDATAATAALQYRRADVPKLLEMIKQEPDKLVQTRYSSLRHDYLSIARFSYALGGPIGEVRENLRLAVEAYLEVLERRGTEAPFPVYDLQYDPAHPPDDPAGAASLTARHEEGERDYSVGNSIDTYEHVWMAMAVSRKDLAERIAASIWDPQNADYIGLRSEVCTPNQQSVAYAGKHLFQHDMDGVNAALARFRPTKKTEMALRHQATMIQALASNNPNRFLDTLAQLLSLHGKLAQSTSNRLDPQYFICIAALGMCALALDRNLISLQQLPMDNPFLPLELLMDAE